MLNVYREHGLNGHQNVVLVKGRERLRRYNAPLHEYHAMVYVNNAIVLSKTKNEIRYVSSVDMHFLRNLTRLKCHSL